MAADSERGTGRPSSFLSWIDALLTIVSVFVPLLGHDAYCGRGRCVSPAHRPPALFESSQALLKRRVHVL